VGGARGTNVYTYEAGSTIQISLRESIPHPGYFRIAFDADGDDAFRDPVSIVPIDPARRCPSSPTDQCGASDFYNSPEVLMDNLDPHLHAPGDFLLPRTFTWQVTLPDVACDNCTLQVIQVMEDDAFHGPYDVTPGVGVADVYHQCIDLVLTKTGIPGAGGAAATGAGGANGGSGGANASSGGAAAAGQPAATGAGGAPTGSSGTGGNGAGLVPGSTTDGGTEARADGTSGDDGGCGVVHPDGRRPKGGWALAAAFLCGLAALGRSRTRPGALG
jgi:hypothetical protein